MPSYKDLVKATGLSLGTISIIQNRQRAARERKMVLNAIRELGYRVTIRRATSIAPI